MLPKIHIILGLVFSLFLKLTFSNLNWFFISLVFLASFLIDVDHYAYYVVKQKDLSLTRAYKWFVTQREKFLALPLSERKKAKLPFLLFHGIESWAIILFLSFLNPYFLAVLIGFLFHIVLDLLELYKNNVPLMNKLSVLYGLSKRKRA